MLYNNTTSILGHSFIGAILAFIFVIALIYITLFVLNKLSKGYKFKKNYTNSIEVIERTWLDSKRQAIILKRDEKYHLIMLSPQNETLIETFE